MGGSAILLFGEMDLSVLERKDANPSFFQKLFGRKQSAAPTAMKINDQLTHLEIKKHSLNGLKEDFKKFIKQSVPRPHFASEMFFDYMRMNIMTLYLRGNQTPEKTDWYVQFSFSGCAGMAETSAEIGAHWVEIWLNRERAAVSDFLEKNGFTISDRQDAPSGYRFLPFEKYGYCRILDQEEIYEADDADGSKYLSFDQGTLEALSENELSQMKALDDQYREYIGDNKCRCQLCEPDFAPLKT